MTDYLVVEIVDGIHPYMVEEPTTIEQAQEQLERWEVAHPDRAYLVYTLDEYTEAIRLGL